MSCTLQTSSGAYDFVKSRDREFAQGAQPGA
jgi:hypothetical protein